MIYADNAATTKVCDAAIEAMTACMRDGYGNPSSLYSFAQDAKEVLEGARKTIADCLCCDPKEITFTSCGTEADNQAVATAAKIGKKAGKMHIISTAFEHHAILHTLKRYESEGFEVTLLDVAPTGVISVDQVADAIREDTCLVTIMFANNEIGTIQPIAEIGALCKERGVLFHTDAVQAAGHIPIDVKAQNIDMLSISA
ncbi:MAG: aminotransferase class V-fold PLP-dependent enzyme, partial [Coriobacteriales bacterium]|nr:aminotransferase class V-fold PLP-dependent enzyme [Coriobacteriales bacterium]